MLTRATRTRLAVFAIITVVILAITAVKYIRLPQLLGFEQYAVTANFADATGLYSNAIVTYRGSPVGKVGDITLEPDGVRVTLNIDDGQHIPADSVASIRSTSAIGEQYVDLDPKAGGDDSRLLRDGSQIPRGHTIGLPRTDDMLSSLEQLLKSLPKQAIGRTLDDLSTALKNSGPDLQQLLDSSSQLLDAADANFAPTRDLIDDLAPFLRTQQDLAPQTTSTVSDLTSFTHQLVLSQDDIVSLLHKIPQGTMQLVGVERDLTPSLNLLLANLTSNARAMNPYLPGVKQTLSIYPALVATLISFAQPTAGTGFIPLYFHLNIQDPGDCIQGFLPVKDRRSPDATTTINTPTGLYCKLAPNAKYSVRGTRNLPCLNNPGVRAATPQQCLGLKENDSVAGPSAGELAMSNGGARTWQDLLLRPVGK